MSTPRNAGNPDPLSITVPERYMWHGQLRHVLLLAVLVPGAWAIAGYSLGDGSFLGISDEAWFVAAIAVPIIQQLAVALLWRAQLCHGLLTRMFGGAGFIVWGVIFFPLLVARPLLVAAVGAADVGSLPIPDTPAIAAGSLMLLPAVWTMHSVKKYFGFARALGGDHFFERYRAMPMIREGAFKYSSNAMYAFVFLGLWGIAYCSAPAPLSQPQRSSTLISGCIGIAPSSPMGSCSMAARPTKTDEIEAHTSRFLRPGSSRRVRQFRHGVP